MKHRFLHGVDQDRAANAVKQAFQHYHRRYPNYGLDLAWTGPFSATLSFRAKGLAIRCDLAIEPDAVEVEVDLPLILRPFQGRVKTLAEREARVWIERLSAPDQD